MSSPPESEIGGHHAISEDEDEPGRDDEDVERGAVEGFILSDDAEPAQSTSGGRYSPKRDGQAFRTSNKPWESHAPLLDREGFENGNDAHTLDDSPAQPQGSPDGSLSNPDDTPSVQVRAGRVLHVTIGNANGLRDRWPHPWDVRFAIPADLYLG